MESLELKCAAPNNTWGLHISHTFFKIKIFIESQLDGRYNVVQYE